MIRLFDIVVKPTLPSLPSEIAEVVIHILERSANFLISEVVMRPLNPKR